MTTKIFRTCLLFMVLCGIGFGIGEVLLRRSYSIVPSLSVSLAPFSPEGRPTTYAYGPDPKNCRSHPLADGQQPPVSWKHTFEGEGDVLRIFVVGDSTAMGSGVAPKYTYAHRIAQKMHESTEQPVELYNLGYNAAGYCIYLQ